MRGGWSRWRGPSAAARRWARVVPGANLGVWQGDAAPKYRDMTPPRAAGFPFTEIYDAAARLQDALPQAGETRSSRLRCGAGAARESNHYISRRHGCLPRLCQTRDVNRPSSVSLTLAINCNTGRGVYSPQEFDSWMSSDISHPGAPAHRSYFPSRGGAASRTRPLPDTLGPLARAAGRVRPPRRHRRIKPRKIRELTQAGRA